MHDVSNQFPKSETEKINITLEINNFFNSESRESTFKL